MTGDALKYFSLLYTEFSSPNNTYDYDYHHN